MTIYELQDAREMLAKLEGLAAEIEAHPAEYRPQAVSGITAAVDHVRRVIADHEARDRAAEEYRRSRKRA